MFYWGVSTMRIKKWGFLLSYAIYLVFCIAFSALSKDISAINTMIFAITIASTSFSISDLLFTKLDIDKRERISLSSLYYLTNYAEKFYMEKIKEKYGEKAEKMVSILMELFEGNEDKIEKFFNGSISVEEKENFIKIVEAYSDDELTRFVLSFLESDISDIKSMVETNGDNEKNILELLVKQKNKETIKYYLASIISVGGLAALLIILTTRVAAISYINNILTVLAFLCVMINLLLKEYYKANSLKKMDQEKNKILKDLRHYHNS